MADTASATEIMCTYRSVSCLGHGANERRRQPPVEREEAGGAHGVGDAAEDARVPVSVVTVLQQLRQRRL
jgi:hypothetical protein